jgi:hypothetical protein
MVAAAGECRHDITRSQAEIPIPSDECWACSQVTEAIDGLAEVLTGSGEHFWSTMPMTEY